MGRPKKIKDKVEAPSHQLTEEQKLIVATEVGPGQLMKIESYAGSSKTTVLKEYAKARPDKTFLYIAYNTTVAAEARETFPKNVTPRTSHSLAYAKFGFRYRHKLGNLRPYILKDHLEIKNFPVGKFIIDVLDKFLCSADFKINEDHLVLADDNVNSYTDRKSLGNVTYLLSKVNELWKAMRDVNNASVPMTHDGYLKLYQLSKPIVSFDYVMLEEAHDLNSCVFDLFINQPAAKIMVYDKNQCLYFFRYADGSICDYKSDITRYLSTSFRFGPNIASIANLVLNNLKNEKRQLIGFHPVDEIGLVNTNKPYTIIAHTNCALFDEAANLILTDNPPTFGFLGASERENYSPLKHYYFDRILDVYNLFMGNKKDIKDFYIIRFKNFDEFIHTINDKDAPDIELISRAKVVQKYQYNVPELIKKIIANSINPAKAHVTFTTAHRSKGKEFSQVKLTNDYIDLVVEDEKTGEKRLVRKDEVSQQNVNLSYVALTRSQKVLQLNKQLIDLRSFLDGQDSDKQLESPYGE